MIPTRIILTLLKYGLLSLVATGAGLLIANTAVVKRYVHERIEDLPYKARTSVRSDSSVLDKNSWRCLIEPRRPFCSLPSKRRLELLNSKLSPSPPINQKDSVPDSLVKPIVHPVYEAIRNFKELFYSLKVIPVLLEPSMLFCMLSPHHKHNLVSNGLNPQVLKQSANVITFGVKRQDSEILNKESSINKTVQSGYKFSKSSESKPDPHFKGVPSHYFYYWRNRTVQVVVLFERGNFLWNPGISAKRLGIQESFFTRRFAYENFTFVPLKFENGKETKFYIPSDTVSFLSQIQNSEFYECLPTSSEDKSSAGVSDMTIDQLNHRASIAIQELKANNFGVLWLWHDTLDGWYKRCNIFQKTSNFNIAVDATTILNMDLNKTLADSKYLQLFAVHQLENENVKFIVDCYGLKIHIFPIYGDTATAWNFEQNSAGELIRLTYSRFRLCSIDLMEQLVYVPCDLKLKQISKVIK